MLWNSISKTDVCLSQKPCVVKRPLILFGVMISLFFGIGLTSGVSLCAHDAEFADEILFEDEEVLDIARGNAGDNSGLRLVAKTSHGALAKLDGVRTVLVVEGTPEEMGAAHGELMKNDIIAMKTRLYAAGRAATIAMKENVFEQIDEAIERTRPFTPQRFYDEIDAMADVTGLDRDDVRRLNNFPELFHCSGVGLRGKATKDGRVLHVRVLDYMRDIGLQENSTIIVYIPEEFNAWISVSYAGFVGTVTAMNEKGLAIGEMGGAGEGKWDGLPMAFMMRRVMEECSTVDEAIELMKSVPLTCDYYYVLSDASGNLAAVEAIAESETPVLVLYPGEENERLPGALDDVVYISGGERAQHLYERLRDNYGKIDVETLQEMIKRPVAMNSNLHDVIFAPETLELWHAEAGITTPACDEPYSHISLSAILDFYRMEQNRK
ncbi:MAG: C45 family autoproteolytic acyltransferase/hydrolase [Thermoguttaceae bacterium]|jgi:predicted choloylglycine hydrolase